MKVDNSIYPSSGNAGHPYPRVTVTFVYWPLLLSKQVEFKHGKRRHAKRLWFQELAFSQVYSLVEFPMCVVFTSVP